MRNIEGNFYNFFSILSSIFLKLMNSGLIYFIILNLSISLLFFIFPSFSINYRIYFLFAILTPTFFILSLYLPEIILGIYIGIGKGFNLRLFENIFLPVFQYPIWVWIAMIGGIGIYFFRTKVKINFYSLKWNFLLFFWMLISLLWTPNVSFGVSKVLNYFIAMTILIFTYILFYNFPKKISRLFTTLFCFAILYITTVFLNSVSRMDNLNIFGFDKNRFGKFLVICFPLITLTDERKKVFYYILFSLGIILSGSRQALLTFIVFLIVNILLDERIKLKKLIYLLWIPVIIYIVILLKDFSRLVSYQSYFLNKLELSKTNFYTFINRIDPYRSAYLIEFFNDLFFNFKKYILGLGIGGYTYKYEQVYGKEIPLGYPHFFIPEVFYELGLLGLILFFSFIIEVFRKRKNLNSVLTVDDINFKSKKVIRKMALNATFFLIIGGSLDDLYIQFLTYGLLLCSYKEEIPCKNKREI